MYWNTTVYKEPALNHSPQTASDSKLRLGEVLKRYSGVLGYAVLAAWAVWWIYSLDRLELWGCSKTWIRYAFFGADFTTQSDYAARLWSGGVDPYSFRDHLFHYPPLVIRLFLWTPLFPQFTALRIWIVVLAALIIIGTVVAVIVRRKLRIEQIPMSFALPAVLLSFPAIFTMERSNFDLITLAVMLIAHRLFGSRNPRAEILAGCLLAVGPWVKLYPGIMGLGLVALRRWKALAGFVITGVAIGLAAPAETLRSFETLRVAVERIKLMSKTDPLPTWSHSLSVAWQKIAQAASGTTLGKPLAAIPGDVAAAIVVAVIAGWVCIRIYRSSNSEALTYPLLLWLNALGSCVGAIANDYSLMFLPLAIVAVVSVRDPWFVRVSMALLLLWWQPIDLPIPAFPLLVIKMLGLIAVGVSLVQRAKELSAERAIEQARGEPERAPEPGAQPALGYGAPLAGLRPVDP